MLKAFAIQGYRSIRDLSLQCESPTVVTGPNGCGKSNLYRALGLAVHAAAGDLARAVAAEGGMQSMLWAGKRRRGPARTALQVDLDTLSYRLELGLEVPDPLATGAFALDPVVKEEHVVARVDGRKVPLLERHGGHVTLVDGDGRRVDYGLRLAPSETALAQLREPERYPELSALREELRRWRFYHGFDVRPSAPLRWPQVGVRTPLLAADGADLAAALQTIVESRAADALHEAVADAFPGAELCIDVDFARALFEVQMHMPAIDRPLRAHELSDGTLRYLCLLAVLHSPRLPPLLVLNEPEASLYPRLLAPLARMIAAAAAETQVLVVTHDADLAAAIGEASHRRPVQLTLVDGDTRIAGAIGSR